MGKFRPGRLIEQDAYIETSQYRKFHDSFTKKLLVGTSISNCSSSKIIQGQECGAIDLSH